MKTLFDIPVLQDVKVLVRVDFNVALTNGIVADDFRIRMTLPTIDFLRQKGAKIILISHIEVAEGLKIKEGSGDGTDGHVSLEPIADSLKKLGEPVTFIKDIKQAHDFIEHELKNGDCVLLENLRFFEGETTNDMKFAKQLASLADIFVNEAFPVSHREHASIVSLPALLPSYAGLQFEKEVKNLSVAFSPAHPCLFVLGGAKFATKLPLIEKFLKIADTIFVGGALANEALKSLGKPIGMSKVGDGSVDISNVVNQKNIMVPVDAIIKDHSEKNIDDIAPTDRILDIGSRTADLLKEKINAAKFILWNGPLGLYEDGYQKGTLELAKMIAEATANGGTQSIIGGGDTITAIETLGIRDKFTFVSTGGGAMLDFLANGTLPGIDALEKSDS